MLHNVDEASANRLVAHLLSNGIDAEKVREPEGSWSVAVSRDHVPQALMTLESSRLLKGVARTTPENRGILPSREEARYRMESALGDELAHSLRAIDGVLEARVHLNRPALDPILGTPVKESKGSASVLVVLEEGTVLPRDEVVTLIARGTGIASDNVAVLFVAGVKTVAPLINRGGELPSWSRSNELVLLVGVLLALVVGGILLRWRRPKRRFVVQEEGI